MKRGIFGGTFDPIHNGHLRLAEDVREQFSLDKVIFIPTNLPPHKRVEGTTDSLHRLEMVRLAVESNPHFICDDMEIARGGVSYTIETVDCLYEKYRLPDRPFVIIGSDLLGEIGTWRKIGPLARKVHFIVLLRNGHLLDGGRYTNEDLPGSSWLYFEKRTMDVTSSEIRRRVYEGRSIRYLVPGPVLEYIKEKGLYKENP